MHRLETDRLMLRRALREDEPVLEALFHLEETARWLSPMPAVQEQRMLFVIVEKARDMIVGTIGFHHPVSPHHMQIGFALHPDHRHRGLMAEALACLLEEGFVTLGLNRISAYCVKENAASARVLERAGFRLEGLLRRHVWLADGMKHDVKLYSLNEEEWRSRDEKRTGGQI